MKEIFKILFFGLILSFNFSCSDDEELTEVQLSAPSDILLKVDITNDDSGNVTVLPQAVGASYYNIDYGNGSTQEVQAGDFGSTTYEEGDYTITVTAFNLGGNSTQITQAISVRFNPPENLTVDIAIDPVNTNVVTVTPAADNATLFDVYFGDVDPEEPTIVMAGLQQCIPTLSQEHIR